MARIRVPIDEDIATAASIVKQAEKKATTKTATKSEPKKKKAPQDLVGLKWSKNTTYGTILLILILLGWLSVSNIRMHRQIRDITSNPQAYVDKQNQVLVKHISTLTDLPPGEIPLIATVSDADQAKSQLSFFANAKNGDKVLQYTKANKLVLYRPSTDEVVQTSSLSTIKP